MQYKAKQMWGRTLVITAVTLSTAIFANASTLSNIYQTMDNTAANMEREALRQDLSNRYSGRLSDTLSKLRRALENTPSLASKVVLGSSIARDIDGDRLLVDVATMAVESGVIDSISAEARANLIQELENIRDVGEDDGISEDAAGLLEGILEGESIAYVTSPNYRRKDNPIVRRTWQQRYEQTYRNHRETRKKNRKQNNTASNRSNWSTRGNATAASSNNGKKVNDGAYFNDRQRAERTERRKEEEQKKLKDQYSSKAQFERKDGTKAEMLFEANPYATLKEDKSARSSISAAMTAKNKDEDLAISAGKLLRTGSITGDKRSAAQADEEDFMPLSKDEWAAREKKQAEWARKSTTASAQSVAENQEGKQSRAQRKAARKAAKKAAASGSDAVAPATTQRTPPPAPPRPLTAGKIVSSYEGMVSAIPTSGSGTPVAGGDEKNDIDIT